MCGKAVNHRTDRQKQLPILLSYLNVSTLTVLQEHENVLRYNITTDKQDAAPCFQLNSVTQKTKAHW